MKVRLRSMVVMRQKRDTTPMAAESPVASDIPDAVRVAPPRYGSIFFASSICSEKSRNHHHSPFACVCERERTRVTEGVCIYNQVPFR